MSSYRFVSFGAPIRFAIARRSSVDLLSRSFVTEFSVNLRGKPQERRVGLKGVPDAVGLECLDGLCKTEAANKVDPCSGVPIFWCDDAYAAIWLFFSC